MRSWEREAAKNVIFWLRQRIKITLMMMRMMIVRRMRRWMKFSKLTTLIRSHAHWKAFVVREKILSKKMSDCMLCHATRTRTYENGILPVKVMSLSALSFSLFSRRHEYDAQTILWIRVLFQKKKEKKTFSLGWWLMIHRECDWKNVFTLILPPSHIIPPPITLIAFLHTVPCFCASHFVWNMQSAKEKRGFSFCFVLLVFSVEANAADKVYL